MSALPFVYLALHRTAGVVFAASLVIRGLGQGAVGVPSISAAYATVPKRELPMATTTLGIVQRLGGPTLTTVVATFLAWRMEASTDLVGYTNAFAWSFVLLCGLHAALLWSTLRLPLRLQTEQLASYGKR